MFDCQSCGACCCPSGDAEEYAFVSARDKKKMPNGTRLKILGDAIPTKHSRNSGITTCIFLTGKVGFKVGCSIYRNRPAVCSKFEPGSDLCIAKRREKDVQW